MNPTPSLDSIKERLERALRKFENLIELLERARRRKPPPPQTYWEFKQDVASMLDKQDELLAVVPELLEVQAWVEIHWNPERQTQPPAHTVPTENKLGNQGEVQLDALSATFKLILAAWTHGVDTVAKAAMEFADHEMIENHSLYLLQGIDLPEAQPLDSYCTLLPYREALNKYSTGIFPQCSLEDLGWPPETADDLCALECRSFERRGILMNEFEQHASPLIRCGPEILLLVLGLVWGKGFRLFGYWHEVPSSIAATLPFFMPLIPGGKGSMRVMFAVQGWKSTYPPDTAMRPLATREVGELMDSYAMLDAPSRKSFELALRRLRDSAERTMIEDKVIDVCIALEILFMKKNENWKHKKIISSRGSWHFADCIEEREKTRNSIKEFYDRRSEIIHGNVPENLTHAEEDQRRLDLVRLFPEIDNVARASLKTMILEGRPQDWDKSSDARSIRHDPPRPKEQIPSVKSDSLSWSLKEQQEIDRALEAVWRPTVDNAPAPEPNANYSNHRGIDRELIKDFRQQGVYYIIRIPALLYMAHPKWVERAKEPLDAHTRYYCERDVKRHMDRWTRAAGEKKVYQFDLELEDATMYLPKYFENWHKLLPEEPEEVEQQ